MLVVILVLCIFDITFSSFFLFFFKQKTAYEMRISDWSSDVCSSDLATRDTVPESVEEAVLHALAKLPVDRFATAAEFASALKGGVTASGEIGRASCRERVCQYV